jgi:non-heme chloroperoxidase
MLIIHGDDEQIVPIDDSARLSVKIVTDATLKIYPDAPHGLANTPQFKDILNNDLLSFIRS